LLDLSQEIQHGPVAPSSGSVPSWSGGADASESAKERQARLAKAGVSMDDLLMIHKQLRENTIVNGHHFHSNGRRALRGGTTHISATPHTTAFR